MGKFEVIHIETSDSDLFNELYNNAMLSGMIDVNLYEEFGVMRGLRDSNGKGVLTGLTEISDVVATQTIEGKKLPDEGSLYYQGYNVYDLIDGLKDRRYAFEEITYLLLFGALPTQKEFEEFKDVMASFNGLSNEFTRDVIMRLPSENIMNGLQRGLLTLYSYDDMPEDISPANVLRQSLQIIAKMSAMSTYLYHAYQHIQLDQNLVIKNPKPEYSTAENLLYMLRTDGQFTELEAKVLDVALVLHAEHGGGNNSTFTTHVVTSSGTDTYSALSAAIASLKGFRHGGANLKVKHMMEEIMTSVKDWENEQEIRDYLKKILDKQAFDGQGLIYGIGHAVYTKSDPREVILKSYAKQLAAAKDREAEFAFYDRVERLAKEVIAAHRHLFKPICANVDFYSGLVYDCLGIPENLFTPIFAISRMAGWSAHRLEEIINKGKIIRPAYKYVGHHRPYKAIQDR
ncbi:MAG: citrate synthase [Clostridia bacterium]|nr:citrate synthase [Clostridia bacterium]